MKKLALFAGLIALVGGTAVAQQDMGNASVSGATYTTGIVESIDGSQLTLRDDAKQVVTILIAKGTVGAKNHPVGSRVRVNFHHNEDGQSVADEIQGAGAVTEGTEVKATVATAPTTPELVADTQTVTTPSSPPEPTADDSTSEASLPRTASPLAAIGLLGLLSLAGALVIRLVR